MRRGLIIAGGVVVIASPIATWWLIGDLSEATRDPPGMYSISSPPEIPRWLLVASGVMALSAGLVSLAVLVRAERKGHLERGWIAVIAMLAIAGILAAFIGRLITARTIGASIGGGLALLIGIPTSVALICSATVRSIRILRNAESSRV